MLAPGKLRMMVKAGLKVVGVAGVAAAVAYYVWFAPVEVVEFPVRTSPITAEVMGTGTFEARTSATISPEITGRIVSIEVDQGDRVSKGQTLLRLDDNALNQQVDIAQAEVAAAEASVERLQADRLRARAVLDQARREHDRIQSLISRNSASSVEMDRAVEALQVAEADLGRSESAIQEARRSLIAAERTLDYRRALLAEAVIDAPFDGLIVRRTRDPGDVVVPGTPVLTLVSTEELWVRAWINESEIAKLQPGQAASVVFRSEPHHTYPGRVVRLGKEIDRETREFLVDVRVLDLPANWAVGQRSEVYIETARRRDATVVPAKLIQWQNGQAGAWVILEGRARFQPVSLGLRGREHVEILEGLQPGDPVVLASGEHDRLRPGSRVSIQ